jgi:hypothetical protein
VVQNAFVREDNQRRRRKCSCLLCFVLLILQPLWSFTGCLQRVRSC